MIIDVDILVTPIREYMCLFSRDSENLKLDEEFILSPTYRGVGLVYYVADRDMIRILEEQAKANGFVIRFTKKREDGLEDDHWRLTHQIRQA